VRREKLWLTAVAAAALITLVTVTAVAIKGNVDDVKLVLLGIGSFIENLTVLWVGWRLAIVGRVLPTKQQAKTLLATFFEENTGKEISVQIPTQWGSDPLKDPGDVTDAQIARERTGE
jgi:hypothetical protein